MKFKYLGTAAAEGLPSPFCTCDTCKEAMRRGGKDIRTRSQAIIDDKILIDFGPDTYANSYKYKIRLSDIRHCLVTHDHCDHFAKDEFFCFTGGYIQVDKAAPKFTLYGSEDIANKLGSNLEKGAEKLKFVEVSPFEPFYIDEYKVTALPAIHSSPKPYIYIIEKDNKTILYANDTDIFPDSVWEYFRDNKLYFNFISFDCTSGNLEVLDYVGHMCIGYIKRCRDKMKQNGYIDEKTVMCLNHFSHNGPDVLYDDMNKIALEEGFIVSYDGMELEI